MSKFLLFAYIVLYVIVAVHSNPRKRSVHPDGKLALPLSKEESSSQKNHPNLSCSCSMNATTFVPMLKSPNAPEIQNVLPPAPPSVSTSTSAFVWKCNLVPNRTVRDDYRCSPGIGSHKLHTKAKVWNEARKICMEEGGHLAIINSQAEANVLVEAFNRSGSPKGGAHQTILLGMHDLFAEGDWVSLQGDSLAKTGYAAWTDLWGGQPDNAGGIQNCGSMIEDGKLDDVVCNVPFPFFCEIPEA